MAGLKEFLLLSVVIPPFLWLSFSLWFSGGWSLGMALYTKDLRVNSRFHFALDGALTQIPREEPIRVRLNLLIRASIFAAQGALHGIGVCLFGENKDR